MNRFVRLTATSSLLAIVIALAGCATPANQQAMTVSAPMKVTNQHPFTVSVTTSGGADTGSAGSSNIGNADLKTAIETSIRESRLFKEVVEGTQGQYQLSVAVTQVDKPSFGASFTVTLETAWSLVRTSDKTIVWRSAIKGSHTATMSDAFVGVTRLRLALEGAARANIEQGIAGVSQVAMDGSRQAAAPAAK